MVFIYGVMGKNTKEIDKIIKCMEWEKQNGRMEENMLESISRIRNTDLARLNGRTEKSILDIGKMANKVAKEFL